MAEKILAPLAGKVFKVLISVGEKVEEDDEAIIVEAMKMETPVFAPCSGTVKDIGGAFLIVRRIVKGMQRTPGARINQVFQPLPDRHLAALIDFFRGKSGVFSLLHSLGNFSFGFFHQLKIFLGPFYLPFFERSAKLDHFFKIRSHGKTPDPIYNY